MSIISNQKQYLRFTHFLRNNPTILVIGQSDELIVSLQEFLDMRHNGRPILTVNLLDENHFDCDEFTSKLWKYSAIIFQRVDQSPYSFDLTKLIETIREQTSIDIVFTATDINNVWPRDLLDSVKTVHYNVER